VGGSGSNARAYPTELGTNIKGSSYF
jgi:hypothetical protein